ncbi:MAG: tetratricopeptide repeat protein, partial [Candidatus Sericytochromatia bacterium]|nr:tetratricopeptide repeat protein [Candidatus Sericytochromatia bacterium]
AVWAMAHYATAEAEQWCRRALRYEAEQDILAATHLRLARHEILGRVFKGRGDLPEAKEHLGCALAYGDQLGDHESKAHILSSLAMVAELAGDYPAAKTAYEEARVLAGSLGSGWAYLRSSLYLSRLHFRNGDIHEALATCRQTLEKEAIWGHLTEGASFHAWTMTLVLMTQSHGDAIREAIGKLEEQLAGLRTREEWGNLFNVLGFLGNAYNLIGLYDQSRAYFTDSLKVAMASLLRPNEAAARLNLALQAHALDDPDEMRRQALQARLIAEEGGYKPIQALAHRLEALAEAQPEKPDQAEKFLKAADAIWADLPEATRAAFAVPDLTYRAWVAQALGRAEDCLNLVETARGSLPAVGDREYALPLALLHAEIMVQLHRPGEARQTARDALDLATELGHASGSAQATRLLASLEIHLNDS